MIPLPSIAAAKALWAALAGNLWRSACVVLLALLAVQTGRIEGFKLWPVNIAGYKAANHALAVDLQTLRDAQKEAGRLQEAVNAQTQAGFAETARKAQAHEAESIARLLSAADAYKRSHTCRMSAQAAGLSSRRTDPAAEGSPAERDNSADDDAEMVAVTKPEFDEYVRWGNRLQVIQGWGQDLIAKQLAVPLPEPSFGQASDVQPGGDTTANAPGLVSTIDK